MGARRNKVQHGSTRGYPEVDPYPDPVIPYPRQTRPTNPYGLPAGRHLPAVPCGSSAKSLRNIFDANHFHQGVFHGQEARKGRNQGLETKHIIAVPSAEPRPTLPSTRRDPRVAPYGSRYCAGRRKANPYPDPADPRVQNRGYTRYPC
ncbi:hypothetical protein R3P38DRAFT_2762995 [Favolaschia claudopus]|uniref:Uncharacterized protein n=1 Tax=Favolaschia claudopus TaxID=2862362 RepID=A0AAW0DLU3_9AGAR